MVQFFYLRIYFGGVILATSRTYEERIEALEKKQEQLKAQKKALQAKIRTQERKARTKHLIEVGAEVERICKITDMAGIVQMGHQQNPTPGA